MPILRVRKYNPMFVYSILNPLINNFEKELCTGSQYPTFKIEQLKNYLIPIPKSQTKIQEWTDKISVPYNEKNANQIEIKKLEKFVQNRIKEIEKNDDCDEVELGNICKINPESLSKNQFSQINYIDIGSVKEENINEIQFFTKKFPSRAKRLIKKNDILFSTVRPNLKGYTYIYNDILNGVASSGFAVIRCKEINSMYVYSLLKNERITEYLVSNATGTKYPAVKSNIFEKIKIKIPKNKQLIYDLEPTFQQIETLKNEVKMAEDLYKKFISELSQEAISK